MSTFFLRLIEERKRLDLNQDDFGGLAGVTKHTQLNYEKGIRKPDSDYLEALSAHGVDVRYLLTGERSIVQPAGQDAVARTTLLLQSRGVFPDGQGGGLVTPPGLALVLDYVREDRDQKPTTLSEKTLAKIARFQPSDPQPWILQPVALAPYETKISGRLVLLYRVKTPVSLVWKLGPFSGSIPNFIELTGTPAFPLKTASGDDDGDERWALDLSRDGSFKVLDRGENLLAESVASHSAQQEVARVVADVSGPSVNIHIGGAVGQTVAGDVHQTGPVTFKVGKRR